MALIRDISGLINVLLVVLMFLIMIASGVGYYFLKVKRITSKQELVDYTHFERRDSLEYVKFDNVISGKDFERGDDEGLIVTDNDRTFTAGIKIQGYSFYNASAEEQRETMMSMMNFLHAVKDPIQLRQSSKAIDISFTLNKYSTRMEELIDEVENLKIDFTELESTARDYEDDPDQLERFTDELSRLRRDIETKDRMVQELQAQIDWLNTIASGKFDTETVSTLFISWHYNPNDYIQDLDDDDIYLKAFTELATKCDILISALARCQCKCERLSAKEILDLTRRHYHPTTSDSIALEDMVNTSIDSLYISSDSLLELQKEAMDDAAYETMMAQIRDDRHDAVERSEVALDFDKKRAQEELDNAMKEYNPFATMMMEA